MHDPAICAHSNICKAARQSSRIRLIMTMVIMMMRTTMVILTITTMIMVMTMGFRV